jgi:hypothetical protein
VFYRHFVFIEDFEPQISRLSLAGRGKFDLVGLRPWIRALPHHGLELFRASDAFQIRILCGVLAGIMIINRLTQAL